MTKTRIVQIILGVVILLIIIVAGVTASIHFTAKDPVASQIQPTSTPTDTSAGPYVALGDSYSSGYGSEVTPPSISTDTSIYEDASTGGINKCYRSSINAAQLLAKAKHYDLKDVSCSGATTDNILTTGQHDEEAQITAVSNKTKLVTLTIGGNDAGLLTILGCFQLSECTDTAPTIVSANAALQTLPQKITNVLTAITSRAPDAKIRIAGYPPIFPRPGQPLNDCKDFLSSGEQVVVDNIQTKLNSIIRDAAVQAGGNVAYIDPYATNSPFIQTDAKTGLGRDACSPSPTKWVNGPADTFASAPYHPNSLGYTYYSTLYAASL